MRKTVLLIAAAMIAAASPAFAVDKVFHNYDEFKADCDAHHGTIVNGVCHAGGTPTGGNSNGGYPSDPQFVAFKADCDAHHGQVYNAYTWAKFVGDHPELHLSQINAGQWKCWANSSWSPDSNNG